MKYKDNGTSTAAGWWLRSPIAITSGSFMSVVFNGAVSNDYANSSMGFAPGFCV